MTLPDEIWVNQKTNTYHTQERSITTRSHASPRVKYVRADAAPKVDVEKLKHSQIKVIRGMLSEDRETYGGYRERKGWNLAIDHIASLYTLTPKTQEETKG